MSEPAVENLITSSFNEIVDSPISLQENSHQLYRTSNLNHDFNIGQNKSYDLNKYDEHTITSEGIKTVLEPFNKLAFDCTNQEKNTTRKLSETEKLDRLESDESLGILPDLLKDEVTFDIFRTGLGFSDDEIHDRINPETNTSPAPLVFSPPIDNQFNRISLFSKNISTPLPNFGDYRRCSSTPKILAANQFAANTTDSIENNSSLHFLSDEKEEPIIAGSCRIKFETDFNLDDLKNVKPLTSTNKALSPPRLSLIFNDLNEEPSLNLPEVSFQEQAETIANNLNVMQTTDNVEKLFPCECENLQNMKVLNNTFQIKQSVLLESVDAVVSHKDSTPSTMKISQVKSNNWDKKEKVTTLDSTFAIPGDEFNCRMDCEKTFVLDFNSTIATEISSKSIYKDRILNETHVLEMDSIEFSSKQQDQIANETFTKDLGNDTQSCFENHSYSSPGAAYKPLNPILEETFSKNDSNGMKDLSKNVFQCINSKSQLASPDTFNMKENVIYSENVDKIPPEKNGTQNIYQIEVALPNSSKARGSNIYEQAEENTSLEQINLDENEFSNKMLLSAALQSISKEGYSFEILPKSSNPCVHTTFSETADGAQIDINLISIENNEVQKSQNPLEEVTNATFSEKTDEVQIELNSIPTKKDNCHGSPEEKINVPFSKLADNAINVQHEIHLSKYNRNTVDETSSKIATFELKDTVSKKTDKHNSSLKNCSFESKTVRKSRLLKPTKLICPGKFSEQLNSQLSIPKSLNEPINDKRPSTFEFNKRISLSCSSANDDGKSKCKTDFKKPFEIPSKMGIKRPKSNFQKSRLDTKYSNGHLKNTSTVNEKLDLVTEPDLISDNNSKIKCVAVASGTRPVSSRLSLHEKLPIKSLKMKECELNTTFAYTAEKSKIISCPKILDLPRKEKLSEIGMNNADTRKKFSRHSIATNLPRKFSPFNNLNNTYNSKPAAIKQKSAPASNSCKPDSTKVPDSSKLVSSISKLKFSSLPKVQCTKTSSDGNDSKNGINKRLAFKNKSNGHLTKPCILEHKAVQFGRSQISTNYVKQKDNTRENAGPNSAMFPPSSAQAAQPLNPINIDKSNSQCNFRPMPKITKGGVRSMNSNDVHTVQQSELQNQVCRRTSGKLPQMRRLPAPRYNK